VKDDVIMYRGRINDDYSAPGRRRQVAKSDDLKIAISLLLNNETIVNPWSAAVGCFITFSK